MNNFDEFIEWEKERAQAAAAEVSELVAPFFHEWDNLSKKYKIDSIAYYIGLCALKLCNRSPITISFFRKRPRIVIGKQEGRYYLAISYPAARYHPPNTIAFNVHRYSLRKREILRSVPHELAHLQADAYIENPGILPQQFQQTIPPILRGNYESYIRLDPKAGNDKEYAGQAVELHASAVEDAFFETLVSILNQKKPERTEPRRKLFARLFGK